jgi:hypothetical protein
MIRTIETGRRRTCAITRSPLGRRVAGFQPVQRLVSCIEATSYTLIRQRTLSIVALCTIVWVASVWLAAAMAQESPSNDANLTENRPAFEQRAIEKSQTPPLLLSMVDRSDREPGAFRNPSAQSSNPHPMDAQNADEIHPPSNPRGAEFASLAALASTPPSSLLFSIQAKGSGQADTSALTNDNKAVVYQLGTISLVINRLPNSFSVSSPGNSLSAR